jgi:hypothetical protein
MPLTLSQTAPTARSLRASEIQQATRGLSLQASQANANKKSYKRPRPAGLRRPPLRPANAAFLRHRRQLSSGAWEQARELRRKIWATG